MPIIIYWKHSTYVEDTSYGLAYHFTSNQKRLHSCTSVGDDVFVVSVVRNGSNADVYLLAQLVVEAQEINPPNSEYGIYRIYGDKHRSRYFSLEAQPLTPVLAKLTSIKPLPEHEKHKYAQAFQTIREISQADAQHLKAFADTLPLHPDSNLDDVENISGNLNVPEKLSIKDWYEHRHSPSVFIMFRKSYEVVWSYSGNELRRVYLLQPEEFISEPIEVPIPKYLDKVLTDLYENF